MTLQALQLCSLVDQAPPKPNKEHHLDLIKRLKNLTYSMPEYGLTKYNKEGLTWNSILNFQIFWYFFE